MSKSAVLLITYSMATLPLTLASIMKHFPKDVKVYVVSSVEPRKPEKRGRNHGDKWNIYRNENLRDAVDKYGDGRVVIEQYPNVYDAPAAVKAFTMYHNELDYIWKTDDDIIYTSPDTWDNITSAYLEHDNVVASCGFMPLNGMSPTIIQERLGVKMPEDLVKLPAITRLLIQGNSDYAKAIWDATFPPKPVIDKLRKVDQRYVYYPAEYQIKHSWSCCHYYTSRETILEAYRRSHKDERGLNTIRHEDKKPIVIDTHTLVYHYAFWSIREWSDSYVLPKLQAWAKENL